MQKILVIEDERAIRDIITDMLKAENFQVIFAKNGREGIELAQMQQPDLILCDIIMPELDGYQVLTAIRNNLYTAAIPFIFLTAKVDKPDVRHGMVLGADDYLGKPFTPDELVSAVEARLIRHTYIHPLPPAVEAFDSHGKAQQLRQALDRSEFLLYYQPQVNLQTGQVVGAEALVRWHSPQHGLVPPKEFIPLAEATGLILPLGEWVLTTACTQARAWQTAGFLPIRIAVNLSELQFEQDNLIHWIRNILDRTQFVPEYLDLEFTESILVKDIDATLNKLCQLKALGVRISIDDFGTGYASLGYLQHFPFDILKIDQCFIRNIDRNAKNAAISIALMQMAHRLQLRVIAEGVETQAEQKFLTDHQCNEAQGYWFSPPLPAHRFEALLKRSIEQ